MNDGMLSQDEINALLNSMNFSDAGDSAEDSSFSDAYSMDTMMQESDDDALLSEVEKDAIGEVANISMGSSATTLYSLVNRKVNITTPTVTLAQWKTLPDDYEKPCVFIQIKYTKGLDGSNILVLKENDVKIITDLMMGGDGTNTEGELGEIHLSAISEAMNQMMGSAATSLSTMLGTVIDISPPTAELLNLMEQIDGSQIADFLGGTFVKIAFRMQIGDLVDSTIMQLYPIEFAKTIVETFIGVQMGGAPAGGSTSDDEEIPDGMDMSMLDTQQMRVDAQMTGVNQQNEMNAQMGMNPQMGNMNAQMGMNPQMDMSAQMGMNPQKDMSAQMGMNPQMDMSAQMGMNPQMMGMNPQMMGMNPQMMGMNPQMMGMNPQMMGMNSQMMGMPPYGYPMGMPQQNVNVQPAQFQNFSSNVNAMSSQENIGLIKDVPLEVTVELGRTTKSIADILDFAPGTIIELDRIAGEPIDVLVNGKFVAKGEVVVIEESFGIRVTEIIN